MGPAQFLLYIQSWAQPREWQHPQWADFPIWMNIIMIISHSMLKSQCPRWFWISSNWQLKLTITAYLCSVLFISLQCRLQIQLLHHKFVFVYLVLQMMKSGSRVPILHCDVRLQPALLRRISSWNHNYSLLSYGCIFLSAKTGILSCFRLTLDNMIKVSPNWVFFLKECSLKYQTKVRGIHEDSSAQMRVSWSPQIWDKIDKGVCGSRHTTGTIL